MGAVEAVVADAAAAVAPAALAASMAMTGVARYAKVMSTINHTCQCLPRALVVLGVGSER